MIYDIADNGLLSLVAVGSSGLIRRTIDGGVHWETVASGTAENLYGVAYGEAFGTTAWVAVGAGGTIVISTDGYSWTLLPSIGSESLYSVAWGGVFMAVGSDGFLAVSADLGATWEEKSSGTLVDLYDITVNLGTYTIVGDEGVIIVGSVSTLDFECLIEEIVSIEQSDVVTGEFQHDIQAAVEIAPGYGWTHIDTLLVETAGGDVQYEWLVDELGSYDFGVELSWAMNQEIIDAFGFLTSLVSTEFYAVTVSEQSNIAALLTDEKYIARLLSESFTASDASIGTLALRISELALLTSTGAFRGTYSSTVSESVSLRNLIIISWFASVLETTTLTDSAARKIEVLATLVDRVMATGAAQTRLSAVIALALALEFSDTLESGKGAEAIESLQMTPTILSRLAAACSAIEQAQISTTASMTLKLSVPLTTSVTATDALSLSAILSEALSAGVAFEIVFNDGETTYRGWAMNMQNFGVTEYQNYPFNSMVKFQGVYLGANANGVYRLDGDTDAGEEIDARIKTGILGFRNQTRVDSAYLTLRSDGDVLLKVITAEKTENWYSLNGSENLSQKRVKFGRGLQSSLYQFELANISGSDLELSGMEIIPVILSRKGD